MEYVKVYHYCYYKTYGDNKSIDSQRIYKRCYIGWLDKTGIYLDGWTEGHNKIYLDGENVDKLTVDIDYENGDGTIMIDYFTIDELNGYEHFYNKVLNVLSNEIFENYEYGG